MGKSKEETILAIKSSLRKSHPNWSEDKVVEVAFKIYNARGKASKHKELEMKEGEEEFRVYGFIRTDMVDQENQVTPYNTLVAWADQINGGFSEANKGDYHHDRADEHLVSVAEYAEVLPMDNGHYGLWVSDFVNAKHPDFETIKYEIENNLLPAYSVEFMQDKIEKVGNVEYIMPENKLWGYAHASRPVDIGAIKTSWKEKGHVQFYLEEKESSSLTNDKTEAENMAEKEVSESETVLVQKEAEKTPETKEPEKVIVKEIDMSFKEELAELSKSVKKILEKESPEKEPLVKTKEMEEKEMEENLPLRFKEMKMAMKENNWLKFKELGIEHIDEHSDSYAMKMKGEGIPLQTTARMRCKGNKLEIVSMKMKEMKFKDILDTDSNVGAYTESAVEFADIFQPGIVDAFNEEQGLFGEMPKVDNVGGAPFYGWTMQTARNSAGGIVDPNNTTVETGYITKVKLHQEIKVVRFGVSVADYTLYHSRASLGSLFELEVQKAMEAWIHTVAGALYGENVGGDGTTNLLGLEAVADSTGNTTLYGKTRSSFSTTLQADALANTYVNNNGDMVEAEIRNGMEQLFKEGSKIENVRIVVNPTVRGYLFNLLDAGIRFNSNNMSASPTMGFDRFNRPSFDGIPIIVDHRCTSTLGNAMYVIDVGPDGFVMVISKAPQLTGLAKVAAAQSAYIEGYITTVYKTPRRIFMYDQNSGPSS